MPPLLPLWYFHSFSPLLSSSSSYKGFLGGPGTYAVLFLLRTLNLPFLTWNIFYPGFCMVLITLCKLNDCPSNPKVYSMYLLFCSCSIPLLLLKIILFIICLLLLGSISKFEFHSWRNKLFILFYHFILSIMDGFRHLIVSDS